MKKSNKASNFKVLFLWGLSALLLGSAGFGQTGTRKITGKILSNTGKPLAAASVVNKRTTVQILSI